MLNLNFYVEIFKLLKYRFVNFFDIITVKCFCNEHREINSRLSLKSVDDMLCDDDFKNAKTNLTMIRHYRCVCEVVEKESPGIYSSCIESDNEFPPFCFL